MWVYNTFYAGYYTLLKKIHSDSPGYTATLLVATAQFLDGALIFAIIQKARGTLIFSFLSSKYQILLVTIPWLIILVIYFSKSRREKILVNFTQKSEQAKFNWELVAILAIILPIILFPILLSKN